MHPSSAMIVLRQHHHRCKNACRNKKVSKVWRRQIAVVSKSNHRPQVDRRNQNDDFDKKQNGLRFGDIVIKDSIIYFPPAKNFGIFDWYLNHIGFGNKNNWTLVHLPKMAMQSLRVIANLIEKHRNRYGRWPLGR